jgi:hypothetical protein
MQWLLWVFLCAILSQFLSIPLKPKANPKPKLGWDKERQIKSHQNSFFTTPEFTDETTNVKLLPKVLILPVNTTFYQAAIDYANSLKDGKKFSFPLHEHSHDILFYTWLVNEYKKTYQLRLNAKASSYDVLPTVETSKSSKSSLDKETWLFFVPTSVKDYREQTLVYWKTLDIEIERIVLQQLNPKLFSSQIRNKPNQAPLKSIEKVFNASNANQGKEDEVNDKSGTETPLFRNVEDKKDNDTEEFESEMDRIRFGRRDSGSQRRRHLLASNETNSSASNNGNNNLDFILENSFLAASYLDQTKPLQYLNHFTRNVRDLRFLRVDNELTPNGRDVFIPYHVSRIKYQALTGINTTLNTDPRTRPMIYRNTIHHTINHFQLFKSRKYFFMAACREPPGGGENTRRYRSVVFDQLKDFPGALVSKSMTNYQFDYGMLNADFCFILPGDTSSTSKLYKAIYSNCIPVIFLSYPSQLPFHHFVDWKKFTIIVYKDVIRNSEKLFAFIEYLRNIRENRERLHYMKKGIFLMSEFFDYEKYDYPSVYHLTLMELQYSTKKESSLLSFY